MGTKKNPVLQTKETKQLTELLTSLHLALKNIQLYPAGHSLVKSRLLIAYQSLHRILSTKRSILFGVARNVITFEEYILGEESPACTAFATILSRHEIASINFSSGVSQHSLFLFLKTVGVLPEQNQAGKTLQQELSSLSIPHIEIATINYDYFERTDDTSPDTSNGDTTPLTWLTFTQKLTRGILGYLGVHTNPDPDNPNAAPEILAAAINKHAVKHPEILQQFSTLLDQMLRQSFESSSTTPSLGGKELSKILTSLNPELRNQFLNTTLEKYDQNMAHVNVEKTLSTFSDSIVVEMLQQINKKNVHVSPALLNLIKKLAQIRATPTATTPASIARQKKTSNLMEPEDYNKHVHPDHHRSLQQFAETKQSSQAPAGFDLEKYMASIEDDSLDKQLVRATLILMDKSVEEEEYDELAARLMEITLLLPDKGDFALLQFVSKTLWQQAKDKKQQQSRKVASKCLQEFTSSDFLNYTHSILPELSEKQQRDAIAFLSLFCPHIIDDLLTIFCMIPNVSAKEPLISLFQSFRLETLTKIFKLIPKTTTVKTHRLLILIEHLGLQGTVRLLHPMLSHEDSDIRIQVLDLLLPINDKEAIATLISMLESKNEQIVNSAIELCNRHNPQSCVTSLLNLLEYQFIKQSAIERNRKLFLILSHIGNSKALPGLEKIAFTKWPFHREQMLTMKRILFYSLKGYRNEDRIKLVKKGLKLKDEEIQKICNSLLPTLQRTNKTP